jgi:hypothetical protein
MAWLRGLRTLRQRAGDDGQRSPANRNPQGLLCDFQQVFVVREEQDLRLLWRAYYVLDQLRR